MDLDDRLKCFRHTGLLSVQLEGRLHASRTIRILATFFYLGRFPLIPGTLGTLGGIPLVLIFGLAGIYGYIFLTFAFTLFAMWVADRYEQAVQDHDTKEVVIDEVAGFLVTMFWLPPTWQSFLFGFLLFRILDIVKPYPISLLDRRAQGGFGTVIDDIVAGVVANIVLQFVYTQTNWLGVQYAFSQ